MSKLPHASVGRAENARGFTPSFGFADGHAQLHKWRDPKFIGLKDGGVVLAGSPDTVWMFEHFTAN